MKEGTATCEIIVNHYSCIISVLL